jgi:hypothetical protein
MAVTPSQSLSFTLLSGRALGIFVPVIPHERARSAVRQVLAASAAKAVEDRSCYGTAEAVPFHKNLNSRSLESRKVRAPSG